MFEHQFSLKCEFAKVNCHYSPFTTKNILFHNCKYGFFFTKSLYHYRLLAPFLWRGVGVSLNKLEQVLV